MMPQALTPLVGRERDLGLLLDRWEQAQAGLGQVVILVGEAGIGKSRLVAVLQDQVAGAAVAQVECRGSALHQHSAWYLLIEFFYRALHWQRHDTADAKLQKLEAALQRDGLAVPEMVPVFAALLSLPLSPQRYPPLSLSSQRLRQQTFEVLLTWLAALAAQGPVLFMVEDLHDVDPSTLEWLDLLLAQGPTARLLTLLTCRPAFQPPWSLRAQMSLLTLGRLPPSSAPCRWSRGWPEARCYLSDVLQQVGGQERWGAAVRGRIDQDGAWSRDGSRSMRDHYALTAAAPSAGDPIDVTGVAHGPPRSPDHRQRRGAAWGNAGADVCL